MSTQAEGIRPCSRTVYCEIIFVTQWGLPLAPIVESVTLRGPLVLGRHSSQLPGSVAGLPERRFTPLREVRYWSCLVLLPINGTPSRVPMKPLAEYSMLLFGRVSNFLRLLWPFYIRKIQGHNCL